jgi:hypothetical protein
VHLAAAAKPTGNTTPGTASPGRIAGFVLDHGRYLPVAPPRGLEDLVSSPLSPFDINDHDQITGSYVDPAGRERSFLLDRDQNRFAQVDVPGAVGTQAQGINNDGQIVGVYSDTGNPSVTGAKLRLPARPWPLRPARLSRRPQQPGAEHQRSWPGLGRVPGRRRHLPRITVAAWPVPGPADPGQRERDQQPQPDHGPGR